MLLPGLSTLLLAGGCLLAVGVSEPNPANASAQASPAPAAAPQEKKDVPATADAIETIKKFIADQKIDTTKPNWKTKLPKPPQLTFDPKKTYTWVMETNKGTMKFKLLPDVAPMHVSSCIYLNTLGFYDGLKFHRVIQGFMAQGGDPLGNGGGNPGYQMKIEIKPEVKHDKPGVLSTARTNDPTTDGSQFFIMFAAKAFLDGQYTVYGNMTDGQDALKKIEACGRAADPAPPTEEIVIKKGTIEVSDAK
jgi:cyclophilin family peptidyl-prolyl cis-trans isomerase